MQEKAYVMEANIISEMPMYVYTNWYEEAVPAITKIPCRQIPTVSVAIPEL